MKRILIAIVGGLIYSSIVIGTFCSCDQYITRELGGTTEIELEPGEKLVEVTWKGDGDLWYLVEPMNSDYVPKKKVFKESSNLGIAHGKVIFIEKR